MTAPAIYAGPAYVRHVEGEHFESIIRMLRYPNITFAPEWNDALIERARARSMTRFLLESEAEVWFTVDGDIVFDPQDVQMICEQAVTHSVVAAQYVTRSRHLCTPTSTQLDDVPVIYGGDPTPVPIKWAATGFLAVHRRVFGKIVKRGDVQMVQPNDPLRRYYDQVFTPFTVPGPNGPIGLSEDYAMCERARREGFTIYINPAIRVGHVGQYMYTLNDMNYPPPENLAMTLTRQKVGNYKIERHA